ncbi:unnamed protein product, partial [Pylaiella littoralis]
MSWINAASIMLVGTLLARGVTLEMAFIGGRGAVPRCCISLQRCPWPGTPAAGAYLQISPLGTTWVIAHQKMLTATAGT